MTVIPPDFAPILARLSGMLTIAHHVPGRIRVKLKPGAAAAETLAEAARFERALAAHPAIRSVALNPLARSCVIDYDSTILPPSFWIDLIDGASNVTR